MKMIRQLTIALAGLFALFFHALPLSAHPDGAKPDTNNALFNISLQAEQKGPVKIHSRAGTNATSGQGYWTGMALSPSAKILPEIVPFIKGAHGTVISYYPARKKNQPIVYWGLKGVGWVAFSNQFQDSWIASPAGSTFKTGNIHGADIHQEKGQLPMIAWADNEKHRVGVTDLTFANPEVLGYPKESGKYAKPEQFCPTDVAWLSANRFLFTDGYGEGWIGQVHTSPLQYEGELFGGHELSKTPHGISYDPLRKDLVLSARPEGKLIFLSAETRQVTSVELLPPGSTCCDVDIWGDYGLVPCLDGPNKTPGPIYVVNLKKHVTVSMIKPKLELGFSFAQHIHDACWLLEKGEVYIVFTSWSPGGFGVIKLVRPN